MILKRGGAYRFMSEYREIYKCRLCGEIFEDVGKVNEKMAFQNITRSVIKNMDNYITNNLVHSCTDGSFGFADFLGYRKIH